MANDRMAITPAVLTWARMRAGYKLEELAKKPNLGKIADWESGKLGPTYRQLEKISKTLSLPMAVFFFPEPPEVPTIDETFRTLGSAQFDEIPPQVRLLMYKARAFQKGLAELNLGRNPAERQFVRDFRHKPDDSIAAKSAHIRDFLGVSLDTQFEWRNYDKALKAWRSALYRVGVTVFKDAFGAEEFCGFSLYDEEFPVIYVNNSNAKSRQTFTLFHELAHLLYRTSGVDRQGGFENRLAGEYARIEQSCNALANAILVPDSALDSEIREIEEPRVEAERLAKRFSVSREVIYRNFLDRGLIAQSEYESAAEEWAEQFRTVRRPGGDYYRTKIRYLGEEYIELAFKCFHQDRIDEEELASYLAIKPKNLEKLEDMLLEGST